MIRLLRPWRRLLAAIGARADPRTTATTLGLAGTPSPVFRWTSLGVFVLVAAALAARLVWSSTHPRPAIPLTDDLVVEATRSGLDFSADFRRPERYGVMPGDRVVEADGAVVDDREALGRAIDRRREAVVELLVDRPTGEPTKKSLFWIQMPQRPLLEVTPAGVRLSPTLGELGELAGQPVLSIGDRAVGDQVSLDAALRDAPVLELRLGLDAAADGRQRELVVVRLSWLTQWLIFAAGLGFATVGFAALWLRPDTRSSWGFLVFCAHAALFGLFRSVPHLYRSGVEQQIFVLLQSFFPTATLLLLVTFTPLRLLVPRLSRPIGAMAAFGAALVGLNWLLSPAEAEVGVLTEPLFLTWSGSMLLLILLALPMDLLVGWTGLRLGPIDRQRGSVLRLACAAGFMPSVAYTVLLVFFPLPAVRPWFELTVIFFPLTIAYAIVRHNFLAIDELAREALLFGTLTTGFVLAYALVAASLVPLVRQWAPAAAAWMQPVIVAGLVVAIAPLHTRLRRRLQIRFGRSAEAWHALSAELEQSPQRDLSPAEYCRELVEKLTGSNRAGHVSLVLRNSSNDSWWLAAAAGVGVEKPGPWVSDVRSLARMATEDDSLLIRDRVLDDLRYREVRSEALEVMDRLGCSLVVPMRLERSLSGLFLVGDKSDGRAWSRQELEALRRVARTAARQLDVLVREDLLRRARSVIDLLPGLPARIGRFRIERLLGQGGMSFVYLGLGGDGAPVAIKVANRSVQGDSKLLLRFLRESRALQRLDHPNIVRILEVGHEGRDSFIAMEYLAKGTLDQLIEGGRRPAEGLVVTILIEVSRGLKAALAEGVQHRDIKPRNLFLGEGGVVKVGDFGLARLSDETTITTEGRIFGTPAYLSPEAVMGHTVTWRADQYALGITAWELLAGERPFTAPSLEAILLQHLHQPLPSLADRQPGLSLGTIRTVERMAAKSPSERFGSYDEIIANLENGFQEMSAGA